jgi:hypothetical protein
VLAGAAFGARDRGCGRTAASAGLPGLALAAAAFLAVPAAVLALHSEKSPAVLGVLAPGAIALALAAMAACALRAGAAWRAAAAVAVALAAAGHFADRQTAPAYDPNTAAQARIVNQVADEIYRRSHEARIAAPKVAVDYITDVIDGQSLRVICYERHRQWIPFEMTLPTGLFAEKEDLLMGRLAASDFVFITLGGGTGGYPFDQEMRDLQPKTLPWCETHLRRVREFALGGRRIVLYQRREIPFDRPSLP